MYEVGELTAMQSQSSIGAIMHLARHTSQISSSRGMGWMKGERSSGDPLLELAALSQSVYGDGDGEELRLGHGVSTIGVSRTWKGPIPLMSRPTASSSGMPEGGVHGESLTRQLSEKSKVIEVRVHTGPSGASAWISWSMSVR